MFGVKTTIMWHVSNAQHVATFPGTFDNLRSLVKERAGDALVRLCKMYNRGDLLPTAQDYDGLRKEGMSEQEVTKMAEDEFRARQEMISETCRAELTSISETTKLVINMNSE